MELIDTPNPNAKKILVDHDYEIAIYINKENTEDVGIGKLLIEIEGKPNIEVDLVAKEDVGSVNPFFKSIAALKYLIFGSTLDE